MVENTENNAQFALDREKETLYQNRPVELADALQIVLDDTVLSPKERLDFFQSLERAYRVFHEANIDVRSFAQSALEAFRSEKDNTR